MLLVTTGITEATCTALPLVTPLTATTAVNVPALGAVENVTVNDVAVAAVTAPTAPLLKVTTLSASVVLKLVPAIVNVLVLAFRLAVLAVTVGVDALATTVATLTAVPLERVLVVTEAFKLPAAVGLVVIVTVSCVVVALAMVPTGPPTKVTVLFVRVGSKPNPLMMSVVPLSARFVLAVVTTGLTVATCTAASAATPFVVTVAVSVPAQGFVEYDTVRAVAVAAVTVPTAPLLNVTVLLAAVVLNPEPLMVNVLALANAAEVFCVAIGRTVAICTAVPLLNELTVTTAVRLPALGRVPNVTVKRVAVAVVTVPTAPLLNTTVLLAAVVLKPKPLMVTVLAVSARAVVAAVTTGPTVAT